ncbi:MAG: hypothetical protein ACRDD8_16335 [Bacteroidales bacterium]
MKYRYSKRSIELLKGVDPKLVIILSTYMAMGKKDIGVTYGMRTDAEQKKLFDAKKSKTMNSKHLIKKEKVKTSEGSVIEIGLSNAIDICAYENGKIRWDRAFYKDIIEDMKKIAEFYRWQDEINWGWDFKSIDDPYHISVKKDGDGGVK